MKAVIIGGGIIGCATAWRLAEEGIEATVLERGRVGQEASWAAAGMIAPQGEADEADSFFWLCMAGKRAFDECVERLIGASGIDPEYDNQGLLYVAFEEDERREFELRAKWQAEIGAEARLLTAAEAHQLAPALSPQVIAALHLPGNRRVDNRKLTQAYASAAVRGGAEFVEGARVDEIIVRNGRATGVRMHNGSTHEGDIIINAAGSWASEIRGLEADRIRFFPVRGQIVCFEARPGLLGPTLYSGGGHLVPRRDGRILAGAVFEEAGYNKTVTMEGIAHVANEAHRVVPALSGIAFREAWAGLRPATDDLMPVIGASPNVHNVLYAAGHFRSGILLSALTGNLMADLTMGRKPHLDLSPFSPARFTSGAPIVKRSPSHT
jgi:glycine oxidase